MTTKYRSSEYTREQKRKWRESNPDKSRLDNAHYSKLRLRGCKQAAIGDHRPQIETIYEIARYLTRKTGVLHVVDHYWPLKGKHSCGLHVPWNLVVITGPANDSKGSKEPNYGF